MEGMLSGGGDLRDLAVFLKQMGISRCWHGSTAAFLQSQNPGTYLIMIIALQARFGLKPKIGFGLLYGHTARN
jgi:hypothetical protein